MEQSKNNITFGSEKVIYAINRVADLAKMTLGASGKNIILETTLSPFHIITNDGISIVLDAFFDDPVENMGASLLKEACTRANALSRDGTTTTAVLTQAILKEAGADNSNPMEIKRSLEDCIPAIIDAIDSQTVQVSSEEDVKAVATVSAESPEIGSVIAEIYAKIGPEGHIELDNSRNFENYYILKEGITVPMATATSPSFFNNESGTMASYENPLILVTDQSISTEKDWKRISADLEARGHNTLVIICDGIDPAVNAKLSLLKLQGKFNFLVIKAPTVMKDAFFEDISKALGATLATKGGAYSLQTIGINQLGTCSKIIVDRNETRFIGTRDMSEHIKFLSENERMDAVLAERIKRLNTKVAVLYLGAYSATDLKYKKDKADDAIGTTKLALQGGIVPGGGVALKKASESLPDTVGGRILKRALKAPISQIIENYGAPVADTLGKIEESGLQNAGFDSKSGTVKDMVDANIIDAAMVIKNSVKAAISVASTALTIGGSVSKPRQDAPVMMMPPGMM